MRPNLGPRRLGDLIRCGTPARSVWMISCSRPPLLTQAHREHLQEEVRFAPDSPLEGSGFELRVPREDMLRFSGSPTINGVPRLVGRHRPGSMVRIRLPSGGESGAKPILSAGCEGASGIVGMELRPHMELELELDKV